MMTSVMDSAWANVARVSVPPFCDVSKPMVMLLSKDVFRNALMSVNYLKRFCMYVFVVQCIWPLKVNVPYSSMSALFFVR